MKTAIGSGLAGAGALTVLNTLGRRFLPGAPRLDVLGMRLAAGVFQKLRLAPPSKPVQFVLSLVGDLVSNALFYGLVGAGRKRSAGLRGAALGLAAGVGAVTLPEPLGLGRDATRRSPRNSAMTVAWYVLGGLIAAVTYRSLSRKPL